MPRHFTSQVIDESPQLLQDSYNLRYQVYCLERGFLPAADYPDELEIDSFDRHSIHLGVLNLQGELAATARLVESSDFGLPFFAHCSLYDGRSLDYANRRVVEVSRLAVNRKYNRRTEDGHYSLEGLPEPKNAREQRNGRGEVVLTLYKALYQASKRQGITHWLAATEKSLQRLVAKFGFPFVEAGPATDYYGSVSPYIMDLSEFDAVILSHRTPLLDDFLDGLEPQFAPVANSVCNGDAAP